MNELLARAPLVIHGIHGAFNGVFWVVRMPLTNCFPVPGINDSVSVATRVRTHLKIAYWTILAADICPLAEKAP